MRPQILAHLLQTDESTHSAKYDLPLTARSRIFSVIDKLRTGRRIQGTLAKDWLNLFAGQSIRLVLQGVYFLCVSRSLGPAQYGAFVAVAAMVNIFSPYAGLGCGQLFQKNVRSGRRVAALCWGNGLLATISTGLLATAFLCALAFLWSPKVPLVTIAAICISDLIMARIIDLASSGFAASGVMSKTAIQNTVMSLLRVIGIVLLILFYREVTATQWAWAYLITSMVGAIYALQQGMSLWGTPRISFLALYEDMREGSFFSLSTSAQTVYNDIDKTMLARLSTFSATGVYAAAYRVIDTSLTPVRSLVSAAYPEVFRVGTMGIGATYSYARRLIRKALIFGFVDFLGLIIIAPLLPHILGPKYAEITQAVQLLAFIPVMRCVHWFLADALSGANAHALRAYIQVGVALLNIGLNFLVLPRWSWVGAAWTSLASDAVLLAAVYIAIQWKRSVNSMPEAVHATK